MVVLTNKNQRPPQPKRTGRASSVASGPTFAQQSRQAGQKVPNLHDTRPFDGLEGAELLKVQYGRYEYSAQECIARALHEHGIRAALSTNVGTAPELVVLGDALLRGLTLGRSLFFQSRTFRDAVFNPSGRSFNVDILKKPHADSWLEPVDGAFFHVAELKQRVHDARRNGELAQYGHVVVISDRVCQSREQLRSYLDGIGAP